MTFVYRYLPALKVTALLAFILFACLPLVQMTLISFTVTLPKPSAEVGSLTLTNYTNIWNSPNLRSSFVNSIAYVLINICITVPVAIPAAYAFSRMSFSGDKHLFLAFIAFRITPPVVLTLPIFQLFSALEIVNSVSGLVTHTQQRHCEFTGFSDCHPRLMIFTATADPGLNKF